MAPPKAIEAIRLRPLFIASALLCFAATGWAVWDEAVTRRPWKDYQARFDALLQERGMTPVGEGIRQVVNPELGVVDRCQSCHLGIDRPGLDDPEIPAVFRTHPRRAQLLGNNHPPRIMGCTTCHHGQGMQTKGVGRAPFDHGRSDPYWETPLLRGKSVESTCVQCHGAEHEIPTADAFNRGRRTFVRQRCYGCHSARNVSGDSLPPAPGPALSAVGTKMSERTLEAWVRDAAVFRPATAMPNFWPWPLAGATGERLPDGDPQVAHSLAAREAQPKAIAAYLSTLRGGEQVSKGLGAARGTTGSPERGQILFDTVGCRGCHTVHGETKEAQAFPHEAFGPDLRRVGELASARWLELWLRQPRSLRPHTSMPTMRLADDEIADLVAYLGTLREAGEDAAMPSPASQDAAAIAEGKRLVRQLGCLGCHAVDGVQADGKAGPDLDGIGSRPASMFAWGEALPASPAAATAADWISVKLRSPRRMGDARVALTMPDHRLSPEQASDLTVFLLSNREETAPKAFHRQLDVRERRLHDGERLLERLNCRGCHEIGRDEEAEIDEDGEVLWVEFIPRGGALRRLYAEPALAPPPLTFAGEKFQYRWLHGFLRHPTVVRPWLQARMPAYDLDDDALANLVGYFAAANDRPYPFDPPTPPALLPADAAEASTLFSKLQCAKCHQVGQDGAAGAGLHSAELAPNLLQAKDRLKPGWLRRFLTQPQTVQPGTRMPTFFPLADDDDPTSLTTPYPELLGGDVQRHISALTTLTLSYGREPTEHGSPQHGLSMEVPQ